MKWLVYLYSSMRHFQKCIRCLLCWNHRFRLGNRRVTDIKQVHFIHHICRLLSGKLTTLKNVCDSFANKECGVHKTLATTDLIKALNGKKVKHNADICTLATHIGFDCIHQKHDSNEITLTTETFRAGLLTDAGLNRIGLCQFGKLRAE